MKRSVKMTLATTAVAAVGGLFLIGSSYADRGDFGGMHGGFGRMGGAMGGAMGAFGEMHREMLADVDTNGDGSLSQEEIDAAVNARFAKFDADNDGTLSLSEFEGLWAEITRPIAVRTFQFLDPDGDAGLSKVELQERFDGVVEHFDSNGDGMLSPDDRGHRRAMRDDDGPRGPGHHRWWNNEADEKDAN